MSTSDKDLNRALTLLRSKMREQGFTQLEVQAQLGWGSTYISQLFMKQKGLRLDQILAILGVIGVTPGHFFRELFPARLATLDGGKRIDSYYAHSLLAALIQQLIAGGMVSSDELRASVQTVIAEMAENALSAVDVA